MAITHYIHDDVEYWPVLAAFHKILVKKGGLQLIYKLLRKNDGSSAQFSRISATKVLNCSLDNLDCSKRADDRVMKTTWARARARGLWSTTFLRFGFQGRCTEQIWNTPGDTGIHKSNSFYKYDWEKALLKISLRELLGPGRPPTRCIVLRH